MDERKEILSKCLATMLTMSKEEYENLTVDNWMNIFGNWKARELRCLLRLYKDEDKFLKEEV